MMGDQELLLGSDSEKVSHIRHRTREKEERRKVKAIAEDSESEVLSHRHGDCGKIDIIALTPLA